jgi:hypothetical protein
LSFGFSSASASTQVAISFTHPSTKHQAQSTNCNGQLTTDQLLNKLMTPAQSCVKIA